MEKLFVCQYKFYTLVLSKEEYKEITLRPEKVRILSPGESIFLPKRGKYSSFFQVFRNTPHGVEISFTGDTGEINFPCEEKTLLAAVKSAVETSGVPLKDFLRLVKKLED